MIGLCGAHRTGKSTLARAFSEQSGVPYVEVRTGDIYAACGLDPKLDYDFETRLAVQVKVLEGAVALYRHAGVQFIADRTPLDFLAYTMADVLRETVRGRAEAAFSDYMRACIAATNEHFTSLFLVQPGIPLQEAPGKAPANLPYMEHLNTLLFGLLADPRIEISHWFMPRNVLDLEQRIKTVRYGVLKTAQRHTERTDALKELGIQWH
jgi:hypothetical protein